MTIIMINRRALINIGIFPMERKKRVVVAKTGLRLLWRLFVILLQSAAAFASEKPSKARYTPSQAQELTDEGLISMSEYSKSIDGDRHF